MKRLSIYFLLVPLMACSQHKYNPEAIKLNDSAVNLIIGRPDESKNNSDLDRVNMSAKGPELAQKKSEMDIKRLEMHFDSLRKKANDIKYEKAIELLNKATQIDSNYFIAYFNKFGDQNFLHRYHDALATGKEMIRLSPHDVTVKYLVAGVYYKTGDTILARAWYQDYLNYCNKKLDTMSVKNRHYKDIALQKGLVLIFLDHQEQGRAVIKKVYEQADDWDKDTYSLYMRVTKADMLAGKELCKTVGNGTTCVNL